MQRLKSIITQIQELTNRYPFITLTGVVVLLFLLIILGNYLRENDKVVAKAIPPVKKVTTYTIGQSPRLKMYGQVEKTGVITITALTGGVVSKLSVTEGQRISKGTRLLSLASNHAGASASTVQRQMAQKQKAFADQSFEIQKDLISKQRDITNKVRDDAQELRKINERSISDTESTLNQNNDLIKAIDAQITYLEGINISGSYTSSILSLKGQKSQLASGNLQLKSALESLRYYTDISKPPEALSQISKDLTHRQLDLQLKTVELSHEMATLQLSLAHIQESLQYPTTPFTAIVQKVWPKEGQTLAPGSQLVTLAQVYDEDPATVVVYVDESTARSIGKGEAAYVYIGSDKLSVIPSYITIEPVKGQLFAIYLPVPEKYVPDAKDGSYIAVELPIGHAQTGAAVPFVPIDVVSQTQKGAYVFTINSHSSAEARLVELGPVVGSFVQVRSGLRSGDEVIFDTSVIANDRVTR